MGQKMSKLIIPSFQHPNFFALYYCFAESLDFVRHILAEDASLKSTPNRPEALKKFRHREMGGPGDARGRGNFLPPKQALISPWPARCGTHGSLRIFCLDG
jgi:hypothetical protein